jgi:hypothetical protein
MLLKSDFGVQQAQLWQVDKGQVGLSCTTQCDTIHENGMVDFGSPHTAFLSLKIPECQTKIPTLTSNGLVIRIGLKIVAGMAFFKAKSKASKDGLLKIILSFVIFFHQIWEKKTPLFLAFEDAFL